MGAEVEMARLVLLAFQLASFGHLARAQGYNITCRETPDQTTGEWCTASGSWQVADRDLKEGDILVEAASDQGGLRNAITDPNRLWPNATVPYIFHQHFTKRNKETVLMNLSWLERMTCVRFVPWNKRLGGQYAIITNEEGCHATLGYDLGTRGYARVNLHNTSCLKRPGTVQHEFLHLLGLKHEQARPDRDQYVTILWNNIRQGHWKNFEIANPESFTTFGLPYNYHSVMHYSNVEFSKNGKPTMFANVNHNLTLGQRRKATEIDLKKIRLMYNC